ncbi:MAG TPA: GNAT family N-acetyltransferase [Chloroflexota bacterium]|nr:GNAT family N-acetyltransferase [Chloroflexota bacterium]
MAGLSEVLRRIETYYDAVPRAASRVEELPPLRLFVKQGSGWPYCARPAAADSTAVIFSADHVARVRARQRELGLPETFEWVAEAAPGLRTAVREAGLHVHDHPLMALDRAARAGTARIHAPAGVAVRLVGADESDEVLARMDAVASLGFAAAGTAVGEAGLAAVAAKAWEATPAELAFRRERLRSGRTVSAVAEIADPTHACNGWPVSVGSHQPVGEISEVVGVATLPSFRRRGIGAAVVDVLVDDALRRGVRTVFLSAGDDDVARMYARLGFQRLATACVAEPPAAGA